MAEMRPYALMFFVGESIVKTAEDKDYKLHRMQSV